MKVERVETSKDVDKAFVEKGADIVVGETRRFTGRASLGFFCFVMTRPGEYAERMEKAFCWPRVHEVMGYPTFLVLGASAEEIIDVLQRLSSPP